MDSVLPIHSRAADTHARRGPGSWLNLAGPFLITLWLSLGACRVLRALDFIIMFYLQFIAYKMESQRGEGAKVTRLARRAQSLAYILLLVSHDAVTP